MEKLTQTNLYAYLQTIKKAASIQNAKVDPKTMSEQEWAEFCMRDGASRLADVTLTPTLRRPRKTILVDNSR